jgi:hypothetical protein
MRSKFAGMNPELNGMIANQLPMDMSAWSGGQDGEEVANAALRAQMKSYENPVIEALRPLNNAIFGEPKPGMPSGMSDGERRWEQYKRQQDLKTFSQGGSGIRDYDNRKKR